MPLNLLNGLYYQCELHDLRYLCTPLPEDGSLANNIFINGRFLTQEISGVQSFARSVTAELLQTLTCSLVVPGNAIIADNPFQAQTVYTGSLTGHLWEQWSLPRFIKRQNGAILLNFCNTGPLQINNQVVTIHDLAFIHHPEWFHPAFQQFYRFVVPKLVRKSRYVLTVSETMRKEISEITGTGIEKIFVAGNKVDKQLLDAEEEKPVLEGIEPGRFFLMVGSKNPRKNFETVISLFGDQLKDYSLVIAGGAHRSFRRSSFNNNNRRIIETGYTSPGVLKWLYKNSIALVNASWYEGFGIPNLEAIAFGCPVLCSDIPAFREVCGNAALYFNPADKIQILGCMQTILSDADSRNHISSEGKVIFTKYQSSDRVKVIREVLSV